MFLFKIQNKQRNTKNKVEKKRNFCFVYIKTKLKKYIYNHDKRKPLKTQVFVLCQFILEKQSFIFSQKEIKTTTLSKRKVTKQMVFYVALFKLNRVFKALVFLLILRPINTCFLINLYSTFNIKKIKKTLFYLKQIICFLYYNNNNKHNPGVCFF